MKNEFFYGREMYWLFIIAIIGFISCNTGSNHEGKSAKNIPVAYRKITGKVVNAADMKPIGGSILTFNNPIKNIPVATVTDSEGNFVLDSIPTSVKKITVVNVSANKSKEVTLNEEGNIVIKMD